MIYFFDTYYQDNTANTAVVGVQQWEAEMPDFELTEVTYQSNEYESGAFYKRELPCLLSIIKKIQLNPQEDILVVDGYVVLSDEGKLGLGGYLFHELEGKIPVIGVAKNDFVSLHHLKKAVYRGDSKKPLLVTTLGFSLEEASKKVAMMHGAYRIPTILKRADQMSRSL